MPMGEAALILPTEKPRVLGIGTVLIHELHAGFGPLRTSHYGTTNLVVLGKVRKVLVHEISRLARKNSVTHRFIESLEECNVSLYWHAQAIETLLDNGKRNPAAGIMVALLAEMARNETETLRERIQSGLAEAHRKGITLGRPVGTKLPREKFLHRHRNILRQLIARVPQHASIHAARVRQRALKLSPRILLQLRKPLHLHTSAVLKSAAPSPVWP
jgi:flagellar biosynthesis/type III secretory pathway protein FliH